MATVTASYNWVSGETVTPTKLNSTAAPTVVVADNEVTTAKILNGAVTDAKLATGIDASKLTTGTLPIARIADGAVVNDKLSLAANAGEIKKALNADNSPPIYACRAWVNFDSTRNEADTGASTNGANVKIRASGNVSSVLKNAAGDYTITFATAMPDANYAASVLVWCTDNGGVNAGTTSARGPCGAHIKGTTVPTASTVTIQTLYGSSAAADGAVGEFSGVYVAIFR